MNYSNPRMEAMIDGWPMGGNKRGRAVFAIEEDANRGQRAVRTTCCAGKFSKPKRDTYNLRTRIVDGDDGKTYIIGMTMYGFVNVVRGDMQTTEETVWPKDDRWPALVAMFDYAPEEISRLQKLLAA